MSEKLTVLEKTVAGVVKKMYRDKVLGKRKNVNFSVTRKVVDSIFKKRNVKDDLFFYKVHAYHKKYCNLYDQKLHRATRSSKVKSVIEKYPHIDLKAIFALALIEDRMNLTKDDIDFIENCILIISDSLTSANS